MDHWTDRPPAPTEFAGIRLLRVPPRACYDAIITSPKMVGRYTHFVNRRTVPHTDGDCQPCLDGHIPRWHGYVSIYNPATHSHSVLELTALAAGPLADFEDRHGSLRGAELRAQRIGSAPNSPVRCIVTAADHDQRKLPRAVDLRKFLCTIWRLPYTEPTQQQPPQPETQRDPDQ
jgi:hypothetical protein